MKKSILCLTVITLSLSIIFSACKKDNVQSSADNSSQVSTQADDQSMTSGESDVVLNDANTSLESSASISGREEDVQSLICDATVVKDTLNSVKTITITYNGANCAGNRTRTGVVTISIPAGIHWKDAGAIVTINFKNLKITRVRDGKSITINGTHTVTNVTGGLLINLPNLASITHTITSNNMSVTFDDGSMRTWQVAKQRVFIYNNGVVITTTGTHTDGANAGIETWGTTRYGNAFTNSILTPLVRRQDCSYRLVSGVYQHVSILATTDVTFGLDVNGNPTTCPGTGTYYYKAVWTGINGKIKTVIAPY